MSPMKIPEQHVTIHDILEANRDDPDVAAFIEEEREWLECEDCQFLWQLKDRFQSWLDRRRRAEARASGEPEGEADV